MSTEKRELKAPPSIDTANSAQEMIRFWIADNTEHVSLRVGDAAEPSKEPTMWGFMLADIAKHVTDAFKELHPEGPEKEDIIKEIVTGFLNRIQFGPKSPGDVQKMGD
jgi:Domain of unknown function (DUF5076)